MKERDPLEDFILKNRESFDSMEVPDRVWNGVNSNVNSEPKVRSMRVMWMALAACFIMLIGCIFFVNRSSSDDNLKMAFEELDKEIPEMKSYYSKQVKNKFNAIKGFDIDGNIQKDLDQSDEFLRELENELKDVPPSKREAVMEAMIKNYQYKLLLLDKVLNNINKNKNQKDGNSTSI